MPTTHPPLGLSVAGAVLAGVCVVQVFAFLPTPWLTFPLIAGGLWWYASPGWRRLAGAFVFGIAWACLVGAAAMAQRFDPRDAGNEFSVQGRVLGLPQRETDSTRFDFLVESGSVGAPVRRRIRIGWYSPFAPAIAPGSRWQLKVRLKRPRGVLNPGGFDFEKSALVQRIVATGSVRDPATARQLSPGGGVDFIRDRLSAAIDVALPAGRGRFVKALAVGDTRGLEAADWETLRATGLTHQIAISGFHVGMVGSLGALLIIAIYRLLPGLGRRLPRPQAAALAALVFAFSYTALAGYALPTVRTMLMIGAVLLGRLMRRAQSVKESFALAMLAVLLFDPLSVLAPGFWLSFIGVGWLLWCLPQQVGVGRVRPFLEAQGVAVVGLLPLTVWFFGQASLPGPLTNLLGIPVISMLVVPLALAGLIVYPAWIAGAEALWSLAAWVMAQLWQLLETVAAWPLAMVWLPEAGLMSFALACAGAFWLLLPRPTPGKPIALLLFLPLLMPDLARPEPRAVDIDVIDVGQGLSVLVRTRNHRMLVDTGPAGSRGMDYGEVAVVPALRAWGVSRLDSIMVSHGDNDHAGGLAAVLRAFPRTRVLGVEGWAKPGMGLCQAPQRWRWDGVDFEILHPPRWLPYLGNDSSCVLRIDTGDMTALLPGDISKQVEERLLNDASLDLRAMLLIAPHHGSATSSSPAFVARTQPTWTVMATGADNRFHLPKPQVVERYRDSGSQVLDTAGTGALGFRLAPGRAYLRASRRQDQPRYWREPAAASSGYAIGNEAEDR